jgi:PIN domain nuclease of toxin-antitoxin system
LPAILLDTHALLWLVNGETALTAEAVKAIAEAQRDRTLFVSPISGWELAVASQKAPGPGRPDFGGQPAHLWFRAALKLTGARLAPITQAITFEAAEVPAIYSRKDPGDCFLIATARVRTLPIVTRDRAMCDLARDRPHYLNVIVC